MSMEMMQEEPKDEKERLLHVALNEITDYEISSEAREFLFKSISDAFKKSKLRKEHKSRLLEFKDNCRILGKKINSLANDKGIEENKVLEMAFVQEVAFSLCPGFWPFC